MPSLGKPRIDALATVVEQTTPRWCEEQFNCAVHDGIAVIKANTAGVMTKAALDAVCVAAEAALPRWCEEDYNGGVHAVVAAAKATIIAPTLTSASGVWALTGAAATLRKA